ncbi:MAG TPA: metallophosphoesterase family protein [Longimicrobiales bacterium]|nr:metallophosphoesterase family protein [Longimicrobiales bacterium]
MTGVVDRSGGRTPDVAGEGRAAVRVGVVSDTHGLLRPEAVSALRGSDLIVHAGDVGDPAILEALRRIAPVRAVQGNVDRGAWASELPRTETFEVSGRTLHVLHIVEELDLDPVAAGVDAVIYGHTHRPAVERRRGVLFLNPGSAGPRRFDRPVSVARLRVDRGGVEATLVELDPA